MRGKEHGSRDIIPYDPTWPMDFELDRQELAEALSGCDVDIRHVGSTSIPTCAAKPVIDILVGYKPQDKDKVIEWRERVEKIAGYKNAGERGDANAHIGEYCTGKYDGENRCVNHTFFTEIGSSQWDNRIYFKKYLIEHPDEIPNYIEVKRRASENHRHGGNYNGPAGKGNYVRGILAKAFKLYGVDRDVSADEYRSITK